MEPLHGFPFHRMLARTAPVFGALALLLAVSVAGHAQPDVDFGSAPRQAPRVAIYFPPYPPPLDRPVARGAPAVGRLAAPPELAAFINEPFYPQLGTRLATRTLSAKLRETLDQYRQEKLAAQNELRTELDRLRELEPAERHEALSALARRQTPKLVELEQTAETLRQQLSAAGQGWSDQREWHLSNKERRGYSPVEISQVMRAYAHYQPNLLPGQRRLLREISMELLMAAETTEKATANQPHAFFQPELARVILPLDVPAELAARIAQYQSEKSLLKKELFETIRKHDGAPLNFLRNPFRALAEKQGPRLAELETLAEGIRVDLARLPAPPRPPPRSPLPNALTQRLLALLRERDRTERETITRVEALIAQEARSGVRISYRFDEEGLKFVVVPPARGRGSAPTPGEAPRIEAARTTMSEIAETYGRKMVELINERDEIRREVGTLLGVNQTPAIDAALTAANRAVMQQQNEEAYRDYRAAAFEPGLSPEQRRLLFDAAIEQLGLPLPRGDLQPTRRASTW